MYVCVCMNECPLRVCVTYCASYILYTYLIRLYKHKARQRFILFCVLFVVCIAWLLLLVSLFFGGFVFKIIIPMCLQHL